MRTVYRNASIFDSLSGKLDEGMTIVIDGDEIIWKGDDSQFEAQAEDKIIDLSGKYITPGMIDLHVHLEYTHKMIIDWQKEVFRHKEAYFSYLALKNAQEYLKYGFTTLRGVGSHTGSLASLKHAINDGMFDAPRLRVALRPIGQYGNQEVFGPTDYLKTDEEKATISGTDGIIHAVRNRKTWGADHIKTTTTGGVLHGQGSKVQQSLWREEEIKMMVDEAERLGMYVCAHAHFESGVRLAVDAGVRSIEHGTFISEETATEMVRRGTYLVPTQVAGTFIKIASEEVKSKFPPEILNKWETVSAQMVESHRIAYQKGVKIAFGTDAPVAGDHCHSAVELELMQNNIGMSAAEVLQAATITSAEVMRMDQIGSIDIDKKADFIILNNNPLDDLRIFQDPSNLTVIKSGKQVS